WDSRYACAFCSSCGSISSVADEMPEPGELSLWNVSTSGGSTVEGAMWPSSGSNLGRKRGPFRTSWRRAGLPKRSVSRLHLMDGTPCSKGESQGEFPAGAHTPDQRDLHPRTAQPDLCSNEARWGVSPPFGPLANRAAYTSVW